MKKSILTLTAVLLTKLIFSQSLYFGLQGGYNLGLSKQNIQMYFTGTSEQERILFADYTYNSNDEVLSIKSVPVSLGQGFEYGANIGFMYKNFGVELQGNYFKSNKYTAKIADNFYSDMCLESLNFIPTIVFKSDTTKLSFIAKAGLIISSNTLKNYTYDPKENNDYNSEQTGDLSFGAYFGIGAEYKVFKNFYVSLLIDGSILSYTPSKQKIVSYTYMGFDSINQLTEEQKTINFKDEVDLTLGDENSEFLKPEYNLSNIGFKLGFTYYLNL